MVYTLSETEYTVQVSINRSIHLIPEVSLASSVSRLSVPGTETGTITVKASPAPSSALSIPFIVEGPGITSSDYTLMDSSGTAVTSPLTLAAGQTSISLTLTANTDSDPLEVFMLRLESTTDASGYEIGRGIVTVAFRPVVTDVTVAVADSGSGFVGIWRGVYQMIESDAATVQVTLSNTPSSTVIVPILVSGTAVKDTDYTLSADSLTFTAGTSDLTQTLTITPTPNDGAEVPESLRLTFGDSSLTPGERAAINILLYDDRISAGFPIDLDTTAPNPSPPRNLRATVIGNGEERPFILLEWDRPVYPGYENGIALEPFSYQVYRDPGPTGSSTSLFTIRRENISLVEIICSI